MAPKLPRRPLTVARAANQFRRAAKLDEGVTIKVAFGFCTGAPVPSIAEGTGLSTKTARQLIIRLRARLAQPEFNRWHAAYQKLPAATSSDQEFLAREAFLDTLAACYANTTCYRNFTLGNRASRLCRSCPLAAIFSGARLQEALEVVDAVHAFYSRLGIRAEAGGTSTFRLRLIHTTTIATALAASLAPDGRLQRPRDLDRAGFVSVWSLLDAVMLDLAERPL